MTEKKISVADIWKSADADIAEYYSRESYVCFLGHINPLWAEGDFFGISVPSDFIAEPIATTYQAHIEEILYNKTGIRYKLRIFLTEEDLAEFKMIEGEPCFFPSEDGKKGLTEVQINKLLADPDKKTSALWGQVAPPKGLEGSSGIATKYHEPEKKFVPKEQYIHDLRVKELYESAHTNFSNPNDYHAAMTFDTFVVGTNNEFAFSASMAVADTPGTKYNPLFIYGGSGLGKTHLLHAIGHKIQGNHPDWKILYTTSEKFMNDVVTGIYKKSTEVMRDFFRTFDVLMIDDIQFIERGPSVQEEFFNTFNALKSNGKQVVITADRPVREMPKLMERLRTRVEAGLAADVAPPEYETRVAILRQKLANMDGGDAISGEVIEWVADQIQNNVRELEGAAAKLSAHAEIRKNVSIDVNVANNILADHIHNLAKTSVDTFDIIKEVEKYFSLNKNALSSSSRTRDLAYARQIAMFLCRELTKQSLPDIGKSFGGRDHSTVLHSINKIKEEMKKNLNTITTVNALKDKLV
ncbi:MAG: chromosomal replication initiator protein DnaA [Oscillospiraceae bacterium]|nr:chromosomal replication initiator protein DnaA [Oscillospiraceae bacterium]